MKLATARKILFCLRYGIGDLVMELPALNALVRHAPRGGVTPLGARPAIELLEEDPRFDRLICVHDFGFTHWADTGTPALREKISAWLDQEHFDFIVDPSHAVAGVREALWSHGGFILDAGSDLQDAALAAGWNGQEAIAIAVRAGWGIDPAPTAGPLLHLPRQDLAFATEFMRARAIDRGALAISPVASSPLKRWPIERFARIADRLVTLFDEECLLFTGPQRETGNAVREAMRHPERTVLVGPLHLRRVAALLARCRAFVGDDTGLMHLAATVGTPVVALFGPTCPDIYLPAQVRAVALGGRDYCPWRRTSSFGPPECVAKDTCFAGRRSCIDDISDLSVIDAVAALLQTTEPSAE